MTGPTPLAGLKVIFCAFVTLCILKPVDSEMDAARIVLVNLVLIFLMA